jgi:hypothetical protein
MPMQSSHLSAEAGWICQIQQRVRDKSTHRCCQYRAYKGEGPNRVVVLDEEEAMRERTHWQARLCDDARGRPASKVRR